MQSNPRLDLVLFVTVIYFMYYVCTRKLGGADTATKRRHRANHSV